MRHAKGLIEAGAKVMATDVDQAGTVSRHPPALQTPAQSMSQPDKSH